MKRILLVLLICIFYKIGFSQFSNYKPVEKELKVLDFKYLVDSINHIPIERSEHELIYDFIEINLNAISSEINMEIDGPVELTFNLNPKLLQGDLKKSLSKISNNQPGGFRTQCRILPEQIYRNFKKDLDTLQMLFLKTGPTEEYYKSLIEDTTNYDLIIDIAFADETRELNSQRIYKKKGISPSFPNGLKHLNKFLYEEIIRPVKEQVKTDRNLVYLLTIEKDGTISEIISTWNRGTLESNFGYDVIRKKMPKWIPAVYNGEFVRSEYILQIRIKPYYSEEMINRLINIE